MKRSPAASSAPKRSTSAAANAFSMLACGNGRYTRFLLRDAPADAIITAFDLSVNMLARAQKRLQNSPRVSHVSADLTRLPYADASLTPSSAVGCWNICPIRKPGCASWPACCKPGGKLLLLVTEDTLTGAMCSRLWHCRAHNRGNLRRLCAEVGLSWQRELWFFATTQDAAIGWHHCGLRRE